MDIKDIQLANGRIMIEEIESENSKFLSKVVKVAPNVNFEGSPDKIGEGDMVVTDVSFYRQRLDLNNKKYHFITPSRIIAYFKADKVQPPPKDINQQTD